MLSASTPSSRVLKVSAFISGTSPYNTRATASSSNPSMSALRHGRYQAALSGEQTVSAPANSCSTASEPKPITTCKFAHSSLRAVSIAAMAFRLVYAELSAGQISCGCLCPPPVRLHSVSNLLNPFQIYVSDYITSGYLQTGETLLIKQNKKAGWRRLFKYFFSKKIKVNRPSFCAAVAGT